MHESNGQLDGYIDLPQIKKSESEGVHKVHFRGNHSKKVTRRSQGLNQLGENIGLPKSGDVHKLHIRGYYLAPRPLFRLRGRKCWEKQRTVEFLDTHSVGDTAFVNVHVGDGGGLSSSILPREDANDPDVIGVLGILIQSAATDMVLGEKATFTYDIAAASEQERRSLFDGKRICRGYYGPIEEDATELLLEIDSFRIERNGRDQCRKVQNSGSRTVAMY